MIQKLFLVFFVTAGLLFLSSSPSLSDGDEVFIFVTEDEISHQDYAHIKQALYDEREVVLKMLGLDSMPLVTVRLWRDNEHYQSVMEASLGSRAPGSRGYIVSDREIRILLTGAPHEPREAVHEFAHAASLRLNSGFGNNPRWLWEAVAIFIAGETPRPETWFLFQNNKCPSLRQLNEPFSKGGSIYDVGYYLLDYIVTNWGEAILPTLIKSNGDLQAVLGVDDDQFEQDWCAFVRQKFAPEL